MNKDTVSKKWNVLRTQVTNLIGEIERTTQRGVGQGVVETLTHQLKALDSLLKETNSQYEQFITAETADGEFEILVDYQMKIATAFATLARAGMREPASVQDQGARRAVSTSREEVVKLPKLEVIRFDGNRMMWQRFWNQFKTTVHDRQAMSKTHKFSYLLKSSTGPAASAIEGLQVSEENYEHAVQILTQRFGLPYNIVDSHMDSLIHIKPVMSTNDKEGLRYLHQTVEVNTRGLESLGIKLESYATTLLPNLLKSIPKQVAVDFKLKE
ncbi:uncharacterized protein LOC135384100 [Ornithodoros turicata]|uniref:uncharacterized protein LOC135384100 n=1 Tax=Ornithodoros turicata TaxID=34597 RepID=UPI003139148F